MSRDVKARAIASASPRTRAATINALEQGKPDLVVAFPGARDTANMVKQAGATGV